MTRFVGVLLTSAFVFLLPATAHAWSDEGHKVVCALAWEELTRTARGGVKIILGVDTKEQFAEACTWADAYAADHPETASWHFIPVPRRERELDDDYACPQPQSCALEQIEHNLETVREGPTDLDKSQPLKFVIHLVADVHQPLHVARSHDAFGKETSASFLGRRTDLHTVWDEVLISEHGVSWADLGVQLHGNVSDEQREAWTEKVPLDWANESLDIALADTTGYAKYSSVVLGSSYQRGNIEVVLDRLTRAGIRLGRILNDLLG